MWNHVGAEVITADSDRRGNFNLSRARNNAVRQAKSSVVVVADADTIPDVAAVMSAVEQCRPGHVCWPFTTYRHIPCEWVDRSDLMAAPVVQSYADSVGGLIVCDRETYWDFGGFDERFQGWGYEDNAFRCVANTLGTIGRITATVFSFDHPASVVRDMSRDSPNRVRAELYQMCEGRPSLIRELVKR